MKTQHLSIIAIGSLALTACFDGKHNEACNNLSAHRGLVFKTQH